MSKNLEVMKKILVMLNTFTWQAYEAMIPDETDFEDFVGDFIRDKNPCETIKSLGECVDFDEVVLESHCDYQDEKPYKGMRGHIFDFFKCLRLRPLIDSGNGYTGSVLAELEKQAKNNQGDELADEFVYMHKHLRGKLTVNQLLEIINTQV